MESPPGTWCLGLALGSGWWLRKDTGSEAAADMADVMASSPQSQYSLTRAQQSYKSLVQIHEKNGEAGASIG